MSALDSRFKGLKQNKLAIKGEAQTKNRNEGLHFEWDPEVMRQTLVLAK